MRAYEECFTATSSRFAPWYIVPADDKANARLIVSQVLVELMKKLKLSYPEVDSAKRKELRALRKQLEK
jgi:hypothetical protein